MPEIKGMRNDRRRSDTVHTHMTNKYYSSLPEVQYGTANGLKEGCIRFFQPELIIDVRADLFGKWNREALDAYVEHQRLRYDNLNEPVFTDKGVLITTGENNEYVLLIDKDVFSDYESLIND